MSAGNQRRLAATTAARLLAELVPVWRNHAGKVGARNPLQPVLHLECPSLKDARVLGQWQVRQHELGNAPLHRAGLQARYTGATSVSQRAAAALVGGENTGPGGRGCLQALPLPTPIVQPYINRGQTPRTACV